MDGGNGNPAGEKGKAGGIPGGGPALVGDGGKPLRSSEALGVSLEGTGDLGFLSGSWNMKT